MYNKITPVMKIPHSFLMCVQSYCIHIHIQPIIWILNIVWTLVLSVFQNKRTLIHDDFQDPQIDHRPLKRMRMNGFISTCILAWISGHIWRTEPKVSLAYMYFHQLSSDSWMIWSDAGMKGKFSSSSWDYICKWNDNMVHMLWTEVTNQLTSLSLHFTATAATILHCAGYTQRFPAILNTHTHTCTSQQPISIQILRVLRAESCWMVSVAEEAVISRSSTASTARQHIYRPLRTCPPAFNRHQHRRSAAAGSPFNGRHRPIHTETQAWHTSAVDKIKRASKCMCSDHFINKLWHTCSKNYIIVEIVK